MKSLEYTQRFDEALQFCIDWKPHQMWLKYNKIDPSEFPEEKLFQQYQLKFKLDKKMKRHLLRNVVLKAIMRRVSNQVLTSKVNAKLKQRGFVFNAIPEASNEEESFNKPSENHPQILDEIEAYHKELDKLVGSGLIERLDLETTYEKQKEAAQLI